MRAKLDEALGEIECQINAERIRLVQKTFAIKNRYLAFGYCHNCPKSPTGHCVYNDETDPAHDDCIYCGDPEDRG